MAEVITNGTFNSNISGWSVYHDTNSIDPYWVSTPTNCVRCAARENAGVDGVSYLYQTVDFRCCTTLSIDAYWNTGSEEGYAFVEFYTAELGATRTIITMGNDSWAPNPSVSIPAAYRIAGVTLRIGCLGFTTTLCEVFLDNVSCGNSYTKTSCIITANSTVDKDVSLSVSCATSAPWCPLPTTYDWDWGDGELSPDGGSSTAHTYTDVGEYKIICTVSNDISPDVTTQHDVEVQGVPVPDFTATPLSHYIEFDSTFTNTTISFPPVTAWEWKINDETTPSGTDWAYKIGSSTTKTIVVTFTDVGKYKVSLKATNAKGNATETKVDYISVTLVEPPTTVDVRDNFCIMLPTLVTKRR